jgi:hypothetical protein
MKTILSIGLVLLIALAGCATPRPGSEPTTGPPAPSSGAAPQNTTAQKDPPLGEGHTESFAGTEYLLIGAIKPDGSFETHDVEFDGQSFNVGEGARNVVVRATWLDPTGKLDWTLCVPIDRHALDYSTCKTGASPLTVSMENQTANLTSGTYVPFIIPPNNLPGGMGASFNVKIDWTATVTYPS